MRRRMLNPEFFVDAEVVGSLDFAGRLFYQGLWCVAEDSGVFELSALALKMKIFPGDPIDLNQIDQYVEKLVELEKVITFESGGKEYGWLKNFHKHQKLDKPSPPTLPLPPWMHFNQEGEKRHQWHYTCSYEEYTESVDDVSGTGTRHVPGQPAPEEKGREGKRREEKGKGVADSSPTPPSPSLPLSDISEYERDVMSELQQVDHYPTDEGKDLTLIRTLEEQYQTVDLLSEARKWQTYKLDRPLIPGKSNARSQFRTWVSKAAKWQKERDEPDDDPGYVPPYWQKYVPPEEEAD